MEEVIFGHKEVHLLHPVALTSWFTRLMSRPASTGASNSLRPLRTTVWTVLKDQRRPLTQEEAPGQFWSPLEPWSCTFCPQPHAGERRSHAEPAHPHADAPSFAGLPPCDCLPGAPPGSQDQSHVRLHRHSQDLWCGWEAAGPGPAP